MISAAEFLTDSLIRQPCDLLDNIYGNLSGGRNRGIALRRAYLIGIDVEYLCGLADYLVNSYRYRLMIGYDILDDILRYDNRRLKLGDHIQRVHLGDDAFDLTDIGFQLGCDKFYNIVRYLEIKVLSLALDYCEPCFVLRRLDVCRET